ncbi:hypothetical protein [Limnofasciculus baicalensis]|uniref:Uncharacterized protein n=1 Tax=Limnofasciculus baicalensis BBK-W-15 TaxID=2699891 RepID=A0AAE3KNQ5_9CYAN|nr:hypothetical protein [Limnofasciculus baicalensis]MCP2730066.1 hypothetical protein [Limnofasciculus baicalensis BBK-W-15]
MNVQLLSIEPTEEWGTFDIRVKIGIEPHKFTMKVKTTPITNHQIQVTHGDNNFLKTFKFSPMIALKISKLVSQFHNHQTVELPANIGGLLSGELSSVN